ncbi:hypothetical protein [Rhodococcus sp. NJ-530]|nr:hypothetical protein [Rhodococcus sp. NJ-530]
MAKTDGFAFESIPRGHLYCTVTLSLEESITEVKPNEHAVAVP